ncbi:MAG: DUF2017 domain-containing protein [Actinomycetia bacterium]|nr:DUF2017 domain-containing protein [Actinomycetes bacterium]MCH9800366.1 DUF2017 domain-containing protein [Actinomycetes bacterium]
MFGSNKRGFYRTRGSLRLGLTPQEAVLLISLIDSMAELLGPTTEPTGDPLEQLQNLGEQAAPPADPALLRLFPDAYRDDEDAAADFRRYTESGLRRLKADRLVVTRVVLAELTTPEVSEDRPAVTDITRDKIPALLGALNDMRLVLGSRLDITDDEQEVTKFWDPDDPRRQQFEIYQWLTWLQATFLDAIAK